MDLTTAVLRALEAAEVTAPPEPLVALLRGHISTSAISQHIAQHTKQRVQERAPDGERFAALHEELRSRGIQELDRLTTFLSRVAEEKAVVQMLKIGVAPGISSRTLGSTSLAAAGAGGTAVPTDAMGEAAALPSGSRALAPPAIGWQNGWLTSRPYMSSSYLDPGVREQLAGSAGGVAGGSAAPSSSSLAALPVAQQEQTLVVDLLRVLVGVEGVHIRATAAGASSSVEGTALQPPDSARPRTPSSAAAGRVRFVLPPPLPGELRPLRGSTSKGASTPGKGGIDPSLRELAQRLLPLGERYIALSRFVHARSSSLESGLVMHAFCAALRACLHEHVVGIAQLEQQHRTQGISLQQLSYFLRPAARSLGALDDVVHAVGSSRGGALLRALHMAREVLSGDVEGARLADFLLERTAVPFLSMLSAWVHDGICRDPYGEFMVVERPEEGRNDLEVNFNCQYWQRRFYLALAQVGGGPSAPRAPCNRNRHPHPSPSPSLSPSPSPTPTPSPSPSPFTLTLALILTLTLSPHPHPRPHRCPRSSSPTQPTSSQPASPSMSYANVAACPSRSPASTPSGRQRCSRSRSDLWRRCCARRAHWRRRRWSIC